MSTWKTHPPPNCLFPLSMATLGMGVTPNPVSRLASQLYLNKGKLLIQSLEWLFHNFSETHHFTDHAKNNWENPFCNGLQHAKFMVRTQRTQNRIQKRILMLRAVMQKCSQVFSKKLCDDEVNCGQKSKSLKKLKIFLTAGGEHFLYEQMLVAACVKCKTLKALKHWRFLID